MTTESYPVDARGYTATPGAADYIDMSVPWLNKARHYGTGPDYVKIGKAVRYSYASLDAWLAQHARSCTREGEAA